ncbi:MAG TPA: TerC family protein [Acidobacteriota bacterium]|nr:TerC family protein [Acidobacteriota bacterium]
MFDFLFSAEIWIALITLTVLEVVLGIDNIIFISILSEKLEESHQKRARKIGLLVAMASRILLLLSITWLIGLTRPLFVVVGEELSGRDLILMVGGLFLLAKSTWEIHSKLEGTEVAAGTTAVASFGGVILQILALDVVFSIDSVITAVGMTDRLGVMVVAVVAAVLLMMVSMETISEFVEKHPTIKMLALSFLLLIGVSLIAESLDEHIPKGYLYFAMAFSVFVEMLNLRVRKTREPVQLKKRPL